MKKKFLISIGIIIIIAAAFFIGIFYLPYSMTGRYGYLTEPGEVISPELQEEKASEPMPTPASSSGVYVQERMVIYNAYISLEVQDIHDTLTKIRVLTEGYGGYVAGSSRSSYATQDVAEITIRIPKDSFHKAIQEIESYGDVIDERTTSDDVTEQYIDLKARLENLLKQEKRLLEILEMAKKVEEILEVERELERIRGQIESLQGHLNYLESSVAMSLITVRLTTPPPPFTPPGVNWAETIETAFRGFFAVIRGLIILIVSLLPIGILGGIIYYIYKKKRRRE